MALTAAYPQALYFPYHVSRAALTKELKSSELAPGDESVAPRAAALRAMDKALSSPIIERLVAGLADLTHPHLRMQDLLKELVAKLEDGDGEGAAAAYRTERAAWIAERKGADGKDERGDMVISFAKQFVPMLDAVCGKDGDKLKVGAPALKPLRDAISRHMSADILRDWELQREQKAFRPHQDGSSPLKALSSFLALYQRSDAAAEGPLDFLELPGQYARDTPPQPSTHVRLEGFAPTLRTMASLRKPKCIVLHGSDQRDYRFLAKGGEDLRMDQRVQILFGSMGRALHAHAPASKRDLGLRTYAVLPLSEHVGIIEWVPDTETLKGLISKEAKVHPMGKGPKGEPCDEMAQGYYLTELYPRLKGDATDYLGKLNVRREKLAAKFTEIVEKVPADLLQRAVHKRSVSSEVYLAMRARFARSLATLTACMHILGIGDRHLDNFLLHTPTGNVVGIDFGHAFGSATYLLPVPELMGVRLTRQITTFLRPLDTPVLLKGHMEVTLEALRGRRVDLMRLLEVFLSEPIVDWEAQTRKLSAEQRNKLEAEAVTTQEGGAAALLVAGSAAPDAAARGGVSTGSGGAHGGAHGASSSSAAAAGRSASRPGSLAPGGTAVTLGFTRKWAHERLRAVECKLRGGNSAKLTLRDLEASNNGHVKKALASLEDVVLGPNGSRRREYAAENLTVAEQVDVLIEQATDPNILGRTWQGWAPWL